MVAGEIALAIYVAGSGDQGIISIFSPFNSPMTVVTRTPFCPTQEPTGSMCSSLEKTAIFERLPASLAIDLISTIPEAISGASIANNPSTKPG